MDLVKWLVGYTTDEAQGTELEKELQKKLKLKLKKSEMIRLMINDQIDFTVCLQQRDDHELRKLHESIMNNEEIWMRRIEESLIELECIKIENLDTKSKTEVQTEIDSLKEKMEELKNQATNVQKEFKQRNLRTRFTETETEPEPEEELSADELERLKFNPTSLPHYYQWEKEVNFFFKAKRVHHQEQVRYIKMFTEGIANKIIMDNHPATSQPTAGDLMKTLRENFGRKDRIFSLMKKHHLELYGVIPQERSEDQLQCTTLHLRLATSAMEYGIIREHESYARILVSILPQEEKKMYYRKSRSLNDVEKLEAAIQLLQDLKTSNMEELIHLGHIRKEASNIKPPYPQPKEDKTLHSDGDEPRFQSKKTNCSLCKGERPTTHAVSRNTKNGRNNGIPETCQKIASLDLRGKLDHIRGSKICPECFSYHRNECSFLEKFPYLKCREFYCTLRFSVCPFHQHWNKEKIAKQKEDYLKCNIDVNF